MNGQQPQQDPQITYTDPKAYILYLRSRGLNVYQIDDLVRKRFGEGETPEQRARREADAKQRGGFAQAGGVIGGALVTNEALRGFPNVRGLFGSGTEAGAEAGAEAGGANLPNINTDLGYQAPDFKLEGGGSAAPKVISSEGGMSTVELPTGGTQQVPTESLNDSSFWGNVNWGQVAQGGLGLAQMYGAYKAYKSGDKLGAGLGAATGAGNVALATGAASAGSTLGTSVIPGLNIATGLYTGYKTSEALGDMAAGQQRDVMGVAGGASAGAALGAGIGSIVPGPGTAIGAGIGAVVGATAGFIGSKTGSSKKKPQMQRDAIRSVLQKGGILDDKFQGTLADGSTYDFGKDGSTLKWKNIDKIAETQPTAWNAAVPAADALAASYGFVGQKASDIAAWYAKGAVSNAGDDANVARANMQHFAKQQGITMDLIKTKLDEALKDNRINQDKYNYYMGGAQQLLGGAGAAPQQQIQRPGKGQVARTSPGMYMNDKGVVSAAPSMKAALERNYQRKQSETTKGK